jgi:hypothetical protein
MAFVNKKSALHPAQNNKQKHDTIAPKGFKRA